MTHANKTNAYKSFILNLQRSFEHFYTMENVNRSLINQVLSLQANNSITEKWLELTLTALQNYRTLFDSLIDRLPVRFDVKQCYATILREIFMDNVINCGRIVIAMAFAVYLQQRYDVDLKVETANTLEDRLSRLNTNNGPRCENRLITNCSIN